MVRTARYSMAACGILLTAFNALAAEQPVVTELLKPLNLSGYSSNMRPADFSGLTIEGKKASLAGLRGRVVLLNFWATWCLECRPEMSLFEQLHREFTRQGLSVIGVNARERMATIREYAKELGLTFPLVLDSKGEISAAYGVIGLPTTFLVSRDGRAIALAVGPRAWTSAPARALIKSLLAEPAVPKRSETGNRE